MTGQVFHLNVNCTDLERSLAFYEGMGFRPVTRTTPTAPQPGAAFGLAEVQWDAWILAGDPAGTGVVLDLLQWVVPTAGAVPAGRGARGFHTVRLAVPGRTEPSLVQDPDGTWLRLEPATTPAPSVVGVEVGVADLDAAADHYAAVLGAHRRDDEDGTGDDAVAMVDPATGFAFVLGRATHDAGRRAANDQGIFRCAVLTDDVDGFDAHVRHHGATPFAPPAALDMGPGLPADLRCIFWPDPDGACLEAIESPAAAP